MNSLVSIALSTTAEQTARLRALQIAFAEVCNALVPTVRETRIWNRVTLHHMTYKALRERFPALGSQMVCNAIYSVSRSCRMVFQSAGSPFHLSVLGEKPLPMMRFMDTSPVYFDRHTLSLKSGQVSMYTLDGRMRFQLTLRPEDEAAFHHRKLVEIVLKRSGEAFSLNFRFGEAMGAENVLLSEVPAAPQSTSEETDPAHDLTPELASVSGPNFLPTGLPDYVQFEAAA